MGYISHLGNYTLKNALLWGNCSQHFIRAAKDGRFMHGFIGMLECIPVAGQIVSLAELAFATHSLDSYSLEKALLWGNFKEHYQKTKEGPWRQRAVHAIIATLEFTPVIGQIVSIAELAFINYSLFLPMPMWDLLHFSIDGSTKEYIINQLKSEKFHVDDKVIEQLFKSLNYEYIFILCDYHPKKLIENNQLVLDLLMELEDRKLASCVIQRVPALADKLPRATFAKALNYCCGWFVEWVLENIKIDFDIYADDLLPLALISYNLQIVNQFYKDFKILELDKITDENMLLEQVTRFAIMSPVQHVYELAAIYPNVAAVLPKAMERAALVVRFTTRIHAGHMNKGFYAVDLYLKGTIGYSDENLSLVETLAKKLKGMPRGQLLQEIVEDRFKRLSEASNYDANKYRTKQLAQGSYTAIIMLPFGSHYWDPKIIGLSRYAPSWKHMADICFDFGKAKWVPPAQYPKSMTIKAKEIVYHYFHAGSSEVHATTSLNSGPGIDLWEWDHTSVKVIDALQPHVAELHKELIEFPLDYTNTESRKAFFAKVARSYWLISTLCEMFRGTPHNSMIWLNLIYRHHRLPPPIPKQEHFFLDNTMLMIPFERAIEQWETFFEPLMDEVLSEDKVQSLLEKNGMLLGLCSPKTRNNPKLAQAAIKQNSAAVRFTKVIH